MSTTLTVAWWLLRTIARAVQLLILAAYLAGRWALPRAGRLVLRAGRAGHRWWITRPVLLPAPPAPPAADLTLADLRLKKEANA